MTGGVQTENRWIGTDSAGILFMGITSILFLIISFYQAGYLRQQALEAHGYQKTPFSREAVFTGGLLFFLGSMTWACLCRHVGLMWIAIEATTLASAPLICFHRSASSLEAAWKYLLICSVGIAFALTGILCLSMSASFTSGGQPDMTFTRLISAAGTLHHQWLKGAFILLLVGYGAKMGLAPMHNWLPDAHSEAPSPVSALLSGALLNCAFLGILRIHVIVVSSGIGDFSRGLLQTFGIFSMLLAGVFILRQTDFKRMLAYSSVEHMGILAVGAGTGGLSGYGAILHAVNHSFAKAMLFLLAGNILTRFHSRSVKDVHGVIHVMPVTGILWVMGFFVISGLPPFGVFISELTILKGMAESGDWIHAALFLIALAIVFIGMADIVFRLAYGSSSGIKGTALANRTEPLWSWIPPVVLAAILLLLGVYIPGPLDRLLDSASILMGLTR
jgi:hydrogenase-4 component F